jgi:hypothetical protein
MRRVIPTLLLALGVLTGCTNSLPPETDPAKGRGALKKVLDTWVNGGKLQDLKNSSPPIVAYDQDWEAGHKLIKYEVAPDDRRTGVDLLLTVTLSLSRTDGRAQDKTVRFAVAIGSQTVVLRHE